MHRLLYLTPLLLLGLLASCDVETEFLTGDAVPPLRFSVDTLGFDTVFTERGSATRLFKVYNDGDEAVLIDRVFVRGETGVNFVFNIDGTQGPEARDVAIFGGDSIFVFVEVEVDPDMPVTESPFIAEDLLLFETGTRQAEVVLIAFGQNANYFGNGRDSDSLGLLTCENGTVTLPTDLPVVIYGGLFIQDCTLRALPGTNIYFHGGLQRDSSLADLIGNQGIFDAGFIWTLDNSRLIFEGSSDEPVTIQTDRLEPQFANSPGQYRGLKFGVGSTGNVLDHVNIKNAIVSVEADSASDLRISNCEFSNMVGPAVSSFESNVRIENSLFHSFFGRGTRAVLAIRSTTAIDHTTISTFGADAAAIVVVNFFCPNEDEPCIVTPSILNVRNSILVGSVDDQLVLADITEGEEQDFFDISIENTAIRSGNDLLESQAGLFADFYSTTCRDCYQIQRGDTLFADLNADDYRLDSLSVARNLGRFLPDLPLDLEGNDRDRDTPDAGALEWQPGG